MTEAIITDAVFALEFILAGRAKITIKSNKTGKHLTYKVTKKDDVWFVNRLTLDNTYLYIGSILPRGFKQTRASRTDAESVISFQAFDWFWKRLNLDQLIPNEITLYHAGRCGMCGVELTDPISIKEGYGPECRKKRLRREMMHDREVS